MSQYISHGGCKGGCGCKGGGLCHGMGHDGLSGFTNVATNLAHNPAFLACVGFLIYSFWPKKRRR